MWISPIFLVFHHSDQKERFPVLRVLGFCQVLLLSLSLPPLQQPKDHLGAAQENKYVRVHPPLSLIIKRICLFGQKQRASPVSLSVYFLKPIYMFCAMFRVKSQRGENGKLMASQAVLRFWTYFSICLLLFTLHTSEMPLYAFHPNSIAAFSGRQRMDCVSQSYLKLEPILPMKDNKAKVILLQTLSKIYSMCKKLSEASKLSKRNSFQN